MNGTTTSSAHDAVDRQASDGSLRPLYRLTGTILAFVAALAAGVLLVFVVVEAFGGDDPPPVEPIELGSVSPTDG